MVAKEIFNPFPGLRAFEEDEDFLFFGREKQIDDLLKKLRTARFIAVIGASGSGKSSLVKCGLLPSLYSGFMTKAGSNWSVAVFRPGDDPVGNLARCLAAPGGLYEDDTMGATYASITEATLRRSNLGLIEAVKQSDRKPSENVLIVVDQFEELFRFSKYERNKYSQRRDSLSFVDLLLSACNQEEIPIYIVLTMRSDFMGDCTAFPGLPEAINRSQYLVPRMSREEQREAITGPIAVGGAQITPRLLTQLLNDVGDNPDQLPILQHALLRTWRYWEQHHAEGEPLDLAHYEAIGTMARALSQHAEEAYHELLSERSRKICEVLFKAITEKSEERQGIRRPTKLKEICAVSGASLPEVTEVLDTFRKEGRSFLMPPAEATLTDESIIDISHESLMRIWERLIKWVEDETQSADIYKRLAEAAALYQEAKSGLWRNPELQFAVKWYEHHAPNRAWAQRYDPAFERAVGFLKESKRQEEFEQEQKERHEKQKIKRIRFFAIVLGSAAITAILLLIIVFNLQVQAEQNAKLAEERAAEARYQKTVAESEKKGAEEKRQEAERLRGEALTQKQIAEEQRKVAEEQRLRAINSAREVQLEKHSAELARDEAKRQEKEALDQKQKAEVLQVKAENSEKRTNRLRLLALGQTLAFQSVREFRNNNTDVSALLAVQAYKFNIENGGHVLDPDIYNALAQTTERPVFAGHADGIRSVTVSADGKRIISGANDKTVRIWNLQHPGIAPEVLEGVAAIRSVALAGESVIVAADTDGNIVIWDLQQNRKRTVIKVHAAPIQCMIYDKAKAQVVSGSADGTIAMLSVKEPTAPVVIVDKVPLRITSLAQSPDGTLLAAAAEDNVLRIYRLKAGKLSPEPLPDKHSRVRSICFSHNNEYLATGGYDGSIRIWHTRDLSPAIILTGHTSSINSMAFSPADNLLATASADGTVRLWDFKMPEQESVVMRGHSRWVWSLAFSPNGETLVSASEDRTIRTWTADIQVLVNEICRKVDRDLTLQEWNNYVGDNVSYEKTCSNF
jgi:WD40 repeat protein/energy-coupling factor transporter ATP-binding protein EcfA2